MREGSCHPKSLPAGGRGGMMCGHLALSLWLSRVTLSCKSHGSGTIDTVILSATLARATEPRPHSECPRSLWTTVSLLTGASLTLVLLSTLSSPQSIPPDTPDQPRSDSIISLLALGSSPSSSSWHPLVVPQSDIGASHRLLNTFIPNSKLLLKLFVHLEWVLSSPPLSCTAPCQAQQPSWGGPDKQIFPRKSLSTGLLSEMLQLWITRSFCWKHFAMAVTFLSHYTISPLWTQSGSSSFFVSSPVLHPVKIIT